jgi:hypothetical protein
LISLHKLGLIVLPPKLKLKPEAMEKGTKSGSATAVQKTTTCKMKITKVAVARALMVTSPMNKRKMKQRVPAIATL